MVQYCCVPECKNKRNEASKQQGISFHHYPSGVSEEKTILRNKWIKLIRRGGKCVQYSPHLIVCSVHFTSTDFIGSIDSNGCRKLQETAVPSQFPWNKKASFHTPSRRKPPANRELMQNIAPTAAAIVGNGDTVNKLCKDGLIATRAAPRSPARVLEPKQAPNKKQQSPNKKQPTTEYTLPGSIGHTKCSASIPLEGHGQKEERPSRSGVFKIVKESETETPVVLDQALNKIDELTKLVEQLEIRNKMLLADIENSNRHVLILQAQVECHEKEIRDLEPPKSKKKRKESLRTNFNLQNVLKDPELLTYYTGFENYEIFHTFYEYAVTDKSQNPTLNSPKACAIRTRLISLDDEVLLVLMKLRQNFDNIDLAVRFGITPQLTGVIFKNWANYLYNRLGNLNIWPHRDVIIKNAPLSFKENYPNTILILYATEISTHRPSSLVRQSQQYSPYYGEPTGKVLFGTDGNGGLMLVSQVFTGSISDKELCHQANLFEILKEKIEEGEIVRGDGIMVDKGFNIQKELDEIGLVMNRPAFAHEVQFTSEQCSDTKKIASKRIVVEQAIRKFKSYKSMSGTVPINDMAHLNQMVTVCAILSNFRVTIKKIRVQ